MTRGNAPSCLCVVVVPPAPASSRWEGARRRRLRRQLRRHPSSAPDVLGCQLLGSSSQLPASRLCHNHHSAGTEMYTANPTAIRAVPIRTTCKAWMEYNSSLRSARSSEVQQRRLANEKGPLARTVDRINGPTTTGGAHAPREISGGHVMTRMAARDCTDELKEGGEIGLRGGVDDLQATGRAPTQVRVAAVHPDRRRALASFRGGLGGHANGREQRDGEPVAALCPSWKTFLLAMGHDATGVWRPGFEGPSPPLVGRHQPGAVDCVRAHGNSR